MQDYRKIIYDKYASCIKEYDSNSTGIKHNSGAELMNITLEAGFLKAKVLLYLMLLAAMETFCVF